MARIKKKSRIKALPPKIQIQEKSNKGNTYPSEGFRGTQEGLSFDDTGVVVFTAVGSTVTVNYPSMLPPGSKYLTSELTSSLTGPGRVVAGISDTFVSTSYNSTAQTPFVEIDLAASDGKSRGSKFFATGSAVSEAGEGFDQPLWSKTKFEIDISSNLCSFKQVLSQSNFGRPTPGYASGSSYPMAYFNFDDKRWEGIGTGLPHGTINAGFFDTGIGNPYLRALEYGTYGFSPGIINSIAGMAVNLTSSNPDLVDNANHYLNLNWPYQSFEAQKDAGEISSAWGFPYAAKFHATSSQLLNMSNYISEPFLLEKIVVKINNATFTMFDSVDTNGQYSLTSSVLGATVNNFFILNQRPAPKLDVTRRSETGFISPAAWSLPAEQQLTAFSSPTLVNTMRDVVTYAGISAYTNDVFSSSFQTRESMTLEQTDDLIVRAFLGDQTLSASQDKWWGIAIDSNAPAVTASSDILENIARDVNLHLTASMSQSLGAMSWSTNLDMELDIVSPKTNGFLTFGFPAIDGFLLSPNTNWFPEGGSNGLGTQALSHRRRRTDFSSMAAQSFAKTFNSSLQVDFGSTSYRSTDLVENNSKHKIINPYLLMPSDQLVFGWQLPGVTTTGINSLLLNTQPGGVVAAWTKMSIPQAGPDMLYDLCEMTFDGPAKVIFYGSYVSNNKEHHDTLEQDISSNAFHQVIK